MSCHALSYHRTCRVLAPPQIHFALNPRRSDGRCEPFSMLFQSLKPYSNFAIHSTTRQRVDGLSLPAFHRRLLHTSPHPPSTRTPPDYHTSHLATFAHTLKTTKEAHFTLKRRLSFLLNNSTHTENLIHSTSERQCGPALPPSPTLLLSPPASSKWDECLLSLLRLLSAFYSLIRGYFENKKNMSSPFPFGPSLFAAFSLCYLLGVQRSANDENLEYISSSSHYEM